MEETRYYRNKLGILGWLSGGRYGIERYAFALHRLAGLGLLLYFLMHIVVTSSRIFGEHAWRAVMGYLQKPLFHIGEYLVFVAFAYHGLNGLRLLLTELGIALGRPQRPVYPYVTSVTRQRPLLVALMVVAAALIIFGGYDFFITK